VTHPATDLASDETNRRPVSMGVAPYLDQRAARVARCVSSGTVWPSLVTKSMRPGTRGNEKCLDEHRTGIRDYGVGAVRIELEGRARAVQGSAPVAKERASQRLDERERVRAMAMIWNTALLKIGASAGSSCRISSGARTSKVTPRRRRRSIAISLEGGLSGIDMVLTDALNEPLRPCLSNKRHEVLKQRPRESNERIGAALHRVRSTGLHELPESGKRTW
jgi:hypothetical protein